MREEDTIEEGREIKRGRGERVRGRRKMGEER